MVIAGSIISSIRYNNLREGNAIKTSITAGIRVHTISITNGNIIFLDEVETNSDKIKVSLAKLHKLENIDEITITADKDVSHGIVINVIDIAKQSGFKHFAIATNNK